jgi:hypothetical protein
MIFLKEYTLNKSNFYRVLKYDNKCCKRYDVAFKIGDKVFPKVIAHGHSVHYHKKCYKELFI